MKSRDPVSVTELGLLDEFELPGKHNNQTVMVYICVQPIKIERLFHGGLSAHSVEKNLQP